jgi:uncharacterized protein YneR
MCSHGGIRTVHHRDVQYETLRKYGAIVSSLISFVFRCYQGWECSYSMTLTPAQQQACRALNDVLKEQRANEEEEDMWSFVDDDMRVEFDDDEVDHLDDEEYDKLDLGDHDRECVVSRLDFIEGPVQRCVIDLLISLFTHLPSGADDKFYSPISRFLILYSLKKNGEWLAGRRIMQVFAALLFCGREVMMALMQGEVLRRSDLRYSG